MSAQIKVLIVEDEARLAEMVKILLTRAGCNVLVAPTGKKGMELAHESKFDLIILDIDLPDISGLEICRDLKERHLSRRTPIVFVSGRTHAEDKQHGLELGAVDYIAKPFGAESVARFLAHVKMQRAPSTSGKTASTSASFDKHIQRRSPSGCFLDTTKPAVNNQHNSRKEK